MGRKILDLKGRRFGRLVVLKRTGNSKWGDTQWLCKCDCGGIKEVRGGYLTIGNTKSCGCLRRDIIIKHGYRANKKTTNTYTTWLGMRDRCNNPKNNRYKYYGARGITVCERWNDFRNFLEDMGEKPKGLTIDREDNDGNYEPNNCKWATLIQQSRNSRQTKLNRLRVKNIKQCLIKGGLTKKTLGYIFGVSESAIHHISANRTWSDIKI